MIDPSTVFEFCSHTRYRKVGGEGVVLQQTSSEMIMLNETASDVLELIDGKRSLQDIVEAMLVDYEADPERLSQDVSDYLGQLVEAGVIAEKGA
jgi:hypothetical protein